MLESTDGLVWSFRSLFVEDFGDETAFLFDADDSAVALIRGGGEAPARICRSAPPWTVWTSVSFDRNVGGPLLARWGDRYLVGGRKIKADDTAATSLYWLAARRRAARSSRAAERWRLLLSRVCGAE